MLLLRATMSRREDLQMWANKFVTEVLNKGHTPWHFTFQEPDGPDPWVIFHMQMVRSPVTSIFDRCYHGCPLSVAQDILQNGFIIGESEAIWFCTHGLVGLGRFHAQDRSRDRNGWTEDGTPCLWTQAVTVSFTLPKSSYSSGNHEPLGVGNISLCDVMRIRTLPGAPRCLKKGDKVLLTHPPFGSDSAELHINLRHYGNYQYWDRYLLSKRLTGGSLKLDIFDQLSSGRAILCCCKVRKPFSYPAVTQTCGAITLMTNASRNGWQCSKLNHYWYCPKCTEFRLDKSYRLLTKDRL